MKNTLYEYQSEGLLLEQTGEQKKRAVVAVGRFSPPTVGHYAMFNSMKKFIRSNPELNLDPIALVVVIDGKKTSKDKKRNPLTAAERIAFMTASGKADGIKFLTAVSAYDAFLAIRTAGYEPIVIAAGEDRAENYISMLDKYFKSINGSDIKHYVIKLPRTNSENELDKREALSNILKYVDNELPVSMVSGSLARHAVESNDREKFAIIVGLSNKPKLASMMFDKIKSAMEEKDGSI